MCSATEEVVEDVGNVGLSVGDACASVGDASAPGCRVGDGISARGGGAFDETVPANTDALGASTALGVGGTSLGRVTGGGDP